MGTALIKIKIMPTSPEINLEEIKEKAKSIIEDEKGDRCVFEEEPIAFGLKAVIVSFEQQEGEGELDEIEKKLGEIKEINSVQVIDIRKAFG